jgi:hypothetical protein
VTTYGRYHLFIHPLEFETIFSLVMAYYPYAYTMVHCWRVLKEGPKWRLGYHAYVTSLKNGGGTASVVIDVEGEGPTTGALPYQSRKHETPGANLKCATSALTLSVTFKAMMGEKEEALCKRDDKRHRRKRPHLPPPLISQRGLLKSKPLRQWPSCSLWRTGLCSTRNKGLG